METECCDESAFNDNGKSSLYVSKLTAGLANLHEVPLLTLPEEVHVASAGE